MVGLGPAGVGIVPAAGLAQGIDPPGVAGVPAGTVPARGTGLAGAVLWVPGTVRVRGTGGAVVPAGTVRVRGTGRPWAGRGIGRFGAGPSCGYS